MSRDKGIILDANLPFYFAIYNDIHTEIFSILYDINKSINFRWLHNENNNQARIR